MSGRELALFVGAGTALHWASLVYALPLVPSLPGWFWGYSEIPLHGAWWIVPGLALAALAAGRTALRSRKSPIPGLAALIALCFGLQLGVASLEGRGIRALEESISQSGHWRIAEIAADQESVWGAASGFEDLLARTPDPGFLLSKPPGNLVFVMGAQRAANFFHPSADREEALARYARVASVVWPLLGALTLIPLFALARLFVAERLAWLVCLVYVFVPALQLITCHLDVFLFPLLTATGLAMVGHAARRRSAGLAAASGALAALSVFVSFSLLPLLPLAAAVGVAGLWGREHSSPREAARLAVAFAAGAIAVQLALALALDYDVLTRFERAMEAHVFWKWRRAPFGTRQILHLSVLALVELAWWWGVPLVAGWALSVSSGCLRLCERRLGPTDVLALGTFAVLIALCVLGRTLAEVARLWAFLLPLVCLLAVDQIGRRSGGRALRVAVAVLGLQFTTLILLKKYADLFTRAV